jgi:hypothetical protein
VTWETFTEGALIAIAFGSLAVAALLVAVLWRSLPREDRPVAGGADEPVDLPPPPAVPDSVPDWMLR